jgi:hypothetical protein
MKKASRPRDRTLESSYTNMPRRTGRLRALEDVQLVEDVDVGHRVLERSLDVTPR